MKIECMKNRFVRISTNNSLEKSKFGIRSLERYGLGMVRETIIFVSYLLLLKSPETINWG